MLAGLRRILQIVGTDGEGFEEVKDGAFGDDAAACKKSKKQEDDRVHAFRDADEDPVPPDENIEEDEGNACRQEKELQQVKVTSSVAKKWAESMIGIVEFEKEPDGVTNKVFKQVFYLQ